MAQLFFKYGAMNSGKSIEILKVAHNYEEQGKSVLIFTPSIDDRDEVGLFLLVLGFGNKQSPSMRTQIFIISSAVTNLNHTVYLLMNVNF